MDLTERPLQILLVALYDLALTRGAFDDGEAPGIPITRIGMEEVEQQVALLAGQSDAVFFGSRLLE